jgi:hypothetical protein
MDPAGGIEVDMENRAGCWRFNRRTLGRLLRREFHHVNLAEEGSRIRGRAWKRRRRRRPQLIVGVMRVRNEDRYIARALASLEPIVDLVAVLDNESTDRTAEICWGFDHVAGVVPGWGEPVDELRDFTRLLRFGVQWGADWVFKLDGDEEVEAGAGVEIRRLCRRPDIAVISLMYYHLWDDTRTVRVDGPYSPAINWNNRIYNLSRQDPERLYYAATRHGGNAFLPHEPRGLRGQIVLADAVVWHYGHMDPAERREKYEFYARLDPDYARAGGYDHIVARRVKVRLRPDRTRRLQRLLWRFGVGLRWLFTRSSLLSSLTERWRRGLLALVGIRDVPDPH